MSSRARIGSFLGDRIESLVLDVLELLIEAAYTRDKASLLRRTGLQLEKLRYLVRVTKDLTFLSARQYEFVSQQTDEVGCMVEERTEYQSRPALCGSPHGRRSGQGDPHCEGP